MRSYVIGPVTLVSEEGKPDSTTCYSISDFDQSRESLESRNSRSLDSRVSGLYSSGSQTGGTRTPGVHAYPPIEDQYNLARI